MQPGDDLPAPEASALARRAAGASLGFLRVLWTNEAAFFAVLTAFNLYVARNTFRPGIWADNDSVCHYAYLRHLVEEFYPATGTFFGWTPKFNLGTPFLLYNTPPGLYVAAAVASRIAGLSPLASLKVVVVASYLAVPGSCSRARADLRGACVLIAPVRRALSKPPSRRSSHGPRVLLQERDAQPRRRRAARARDLAVRSEGAARTGDASAALGGSGRRRFRRRGVRSSLDGVHAGADFGLLLVRRRGPALRSERAPVGRDRRARRRAPGLLAGSQPRVRREGRRRVHVDKAPRRHARRLPRRERVLFVFRRLPSALSNLQRRGPDRERQRRRGPADVLRLAATRRWPHARRRRSSRSGSRWARARRLVVLFCPCTTASSGIASRRLRSCPCTTASSGIASRRLRSS